MGMKGVTLLAILTACGACGRSPLFGSHAPGSPVVVDAASDPAPDRAPDRVPDLLADRVPDRVPDVVPDLVPDRSVDVTPEGPPPCRPQPELCNGRDDDCDSKVDQDLVPIPCPAGGSRYCVGGQWSECPRRCEVCVPGSSRVCLVSYCTFWGQQSCASDGRSFGPCRESPPPAACDAVSRQGKRSAALEECCLKNDYCCLDEFDLDNDGDYAEMLGRCEAVTCDP